MCALIEAPEANLTPKSMAENDLIKFLAVIEKVQTLADGGIRVAFDLDAGAIEQAAALMQARRINALLEVVIVTVKNG